MSYSTGARLRGALYGLRTEGEGPARDAGAIAAGLFIGCSPFYGFHLLMCWVLGRLLGLNRLKIYAAANISNPMVAPFLVLSEIQTGAWLRSGTFLSITLHTVKTTPPWEFGLDLLLGSAVVGGALAASGGLATYFAYRRRRDDTVFWALVCRAAERYVEASIAAWEFARGKLHGDPLYRYTLCGGWLPSGGTLLDVGCGHGLMLALLAEAARMSHAGAWPSEWRPPPRFDRMVGIERRRRRVRLARRALGVDAEILESDARAFCPDHCRTVLLFDVLHLISAAEQDALLSTLVSALEPDGVILVREADASAGWRFNTVRAWNRFTALASGAWRQGFAFRTAEEWAACFARHGLAAEVRPMGDGTPFANLLFRLTVRDPEAAAGCANALRAESTRRAMPDPRGCGGVPRRAFSTSRICEFPFMAVSYGMNHRHPVGKTLRDLTASISGVSGPPELHAMAEDPGDKDTHCPHEFTSLWKREHLQDL